MFYIFKNIFKLLNNFDRQTENRLVNTEGKGEDGMIREGSTELHTLPYAKQSASGKLPRDIRSSTWCSVTTWGGCGAGVGGSRERGYMYTYAWFMLLYGRHQHNTVKQLSPNLKKGKKGNCKARKLKNKYLWQTVVAFFLTGAQMTNLELYKPFFYPFAKNDLQH